MSHANDDSLAALIAARDRLNKLACLIVQRNGLTIQFERRAYLIDWLDVSRIQHGVADPNFRAAIDKLSEEAVLSLCGGSDLIQ
jgi:hypothetical protein